MGKEMQERMADGRQEFMVETGSGNAVYLDVLLHGGHGMHIFVSPMAARKLGEMLVRAADVSESSAEEAA